MHYMQEEQTFQEHPIDTEKMYASGYSESRMSPPVEGKVSPTKEAVRTVEHLQETVRIHEVPERIDMRLKEESDYLGEAVVDHVAARKPSWQKETFEQM